MSDDFGTPIEEENRGLRYVDRLQEIRRAICTLDVSLTPSQMVGNKSVALSPMFGSLYQVGQPSPFQFLYSSTSSTCRRWGLKRVPRRLDNSARIFINLLVRYCDSYDYTTLLFRETATAPLTC